MLWKEARMMGRFVEMLRESQVDGGERKETFHKY